MFRYWPLMLWFLYFLLPFDLFPDTIPGVGWTEDFLILAVIYWLWRKKKEGSSADTTGGHHYAGDRHGSRPGDGSTNNRKGTQWTERKDPYKILGVQRPATFDEIKRAYRLQANRYHPDKVSHLGEEFQALAKEKFQEIQWAYEQLQKEYKAS